MIETSLLFSAKGFKIKDKEINLDETIEFTEKADIFYVDFPLTAKTSLNVGSTKIYDAFGPYLDIGLIGKSKFKVKIHLKIRVHRSLTRNIFVLGK